MIRQSLFYVENEDGTARFSSAVAVIFNNQEEVLVGRSTANDDRKGKLCFPGGGIDPCDGRDPEIAAVREAYEEMGVECIPLQIIEHPDKPGIAFVVCLQTGNNLPSPNQEFSSASWIPYVERHAYAGEMLPVNLSVLERVNPGFVLKSNALREAAENKPLTDLIDQFKKDYQQLLSNLPKIKTKQDRDTLEKGISVFIDHTDRTFFDTGSGSAFIRTMGRLRDRNVKNDHQFKWLDSLIREPAWELYRALIELRTNVKNWDSLVDKFGEERVEKDTKNWRAAVGRWGRKLESNARDVVTSIPDASIDVPVAVTHDMSGVKVVNYGSGKFNIEMLGRVNKAIKSSKSKIMSRIPWVWKFSPPVFIERVEPGAAGTYTPKPGGKGEIRINNYWHPKVDELERIFVHEAVHHLYRNGIQGEARKKWEKIYIENGKSVLTTEYSGKNAEESFVEFVTELIIRGRGSVPEEGLRLLRHVLGSKLKESETPSKDELKEAMNAIMNGADIDYILSTETRNGIFEKEYEEGINRHFV